MATKLVIKSSLESARKMEGECEEEESSSTCIDPCNKTSSSAAGCRGAPQQPRQKDDGAKKAKPAKLKTRMSSGENGFAERKGTYCTGTVRTYR